MTKFNTNKLRKIAEPRKLSLAEKRALEAYPDLEPPTFDEMYPRILFTRNTERNAYIHGYEKAEKDIISTIESRLSEIIGDAQPKPVIRAELEDLIKDIKK